MPELSAIVLGYRAGASLVRVVEPLDDLLRRTRIDYELIVVANDAPGDDTPEIAERFAADRETVRVVRGEKKGGMGWDMRSGLAAARGDIMVVIDGDAQNPIVDVLKLYELMRATNADVGKGRRVTRNDGLYRRLVSFAYNAVFQLLFQTRGVHDVNGKPKGLTRAAYERLPLGSNDWFIDAEIVLGARDCGLEIVELPVTFLHNDERASFVKPHAIFEFATNMLRRRFGR